MLAENAAQNFQPVSQQAHLILNQEISENLVP